MERDGFQCADCGHDDKPLSVHHIHYERGDPWNTRNDLLLTVCDDCHKERGHLEDSIRIQLARVMMKLQGGDLKHLLEQISFIANQSDDDFTGINIQDPEAYHYDSELRWFQAALENPSFRPIYEEVTDQNGEMEWAWSRHDSTKNRCD